MDLVSSKFNHTFYLLIISEAKKDYFTARNIFYRISHRIYIVVTKKIAFNILWQSVTQAEFGI